MAKIRSDPSQGWSSRNTEGSVMARSVKGLVKQATSKVAQVPGAEAIVLQAVRDIFKEVRQLRRDNARLERENERLRSRLAGGR
ncbi:MAG: hypothetical protein JO198_05520 [Candidatus Dormibacteraeota bacterium]|nr:hypothetical protein [Candidatus Dormibacteraeota bacterium]